MKKERLLGILLSLALMLTMMPTMGLTAYAGSEPAVKYIDANGEEGTCTSYTEVVNSQDPVNWTAGWYVVKGNVTVSGLITTSGDVHLILCDGAELNVSAGEKAIKSSGNFTVYGQKNSSGKLKATCTSSWCISADTSTGTGDITINGGAITTSGGDQGIHAGGELVINGGNVTTKKGADSWGVFANKVTVNGGTVTAAGGRRGISAGSDVTIRGGEVAASGEDTDSYGIYTSGNVNITNGAVTANGKAQCIYGTVNVDSGMTIKAGADESSAVIVTSILPKHKWAHIERFEPVSYMDWDDTNKKLVEKTGDEACKIYTVVSANTKSWNEGWYVVKDEVTINDKVVAKGNVSLILCDGAKLVVTTESGAAIGNDGGVGHFNLTIYGQKNGTGVLTATGENGIRDNGTSEYGTLTINGAQVTATGTNSGVSLANAILINGGNVTANGTAYPGMEAPSIVIEDGSVNAENKTTQNGIQGTQTVTINGGNVTAKGGYSGIEANAIGGAGGGMTINGGTVTATGGQYGIFNHGELSIGNSNVGATGGSNGILTKKITINGGAVTATGTGNSSKGISTGNNGEKVIINSGNVTANGKLAGIEAKTDVEIKGGTVNAEGTDANNSYGIYANNNVTIEGGTVNARGNADCGIRSHGNNIIISGGKVTARGFKGGLSGTVKNSMAGTGWTDTEGKTGRTKININTDPGQTLTFKRVEFPEKVDPPAPNPPAPSVVPAAPVEIQDLPAVKISKPAKGKKAVTVKWKKVSKKNKKKIAGIEVQITGPGVDQVVTAGKKKTSKKIKGLLPKQKYICRVRAYNYIGGVKHVSAWSKWKTAKTK